MFFLSLSFSDLIQGSVELKREVLFMKFKPIEELTFTDDFMFGYVLHNPEICKELLEQLLQIKIDHVEYPKLQETINSYYDSKGVRLDVYVKDSNRIFDIEIQNSVDITLPKRTRYYQSMLDIDNLLKGEEYSELKVMVPTLIHIEDGKNVDYYEGEDVVEELKALIEEKIELKPYKKLDQDIVKRPITFVHPEIIVSNEEEQKEAVEAEVIESDCLDSVLDKKFGLIICNPPIHAGKNIVYKIFEQSYEVLNKNGSFWIVIQQKHGAPSAIKKLESIFESVEVTYKKKGFYIVKSTKLI